MVEFPLFCYGTLLSAAVREKVLGNQVRLSIQPASLNGYKVMKVAKAHYPALIKSSSDEVVKGALVNALTNLDMSILDKFEGTKYFRSILTVLATDNSLIKSFVYLPDETIQTEGVWVFKDWESSELNLFLSQDFDIYGIKVPN